MQQSDPADLPFGAVLTIILAWAAGVSIVMIWAF